MSKNSIIILVVLSLLLSVFIGCNNDMIDTLKKVQAEVEISVKLPEELKSDDFKPEDFDFTLEWYVEGDSSNKSVETFDYVENLKLVRSFDPGTYIFEIFGKESGTNELKAHGMRSIAIKPGQREQLEIPMTYYVYGDGSGFKVEDGIITLSGKLEFNENKTITVPSGMKLVIADGTEIVGAGNTLKIDGVVEAQGNLTVGGNLEVTENFSVAGDLTFTGDNTLTIEDGKDFVVGGNIIVTGNQEINADTIVGNLVLEDGSRLEVEGTLQVSNISGEGTLSVSGYVGGTAGNITITGSPKIDGDLFLEEDTTLDLDAGANPQVTGSVETDGALIITGDGTLKVTENLTVGRELTASTAQLDVDGDTTTNTLRFGRKPYFVAFIEEGETIELDEIEDGWETVVVSGGGTLIVGSVAPSVEKITLDSDSQIEIYGTLTIDEISGIGSLKANSIEVVTLTAADGGILTLTGPVTVVEVTGGGTVEFTSPLTLEELSIGSGTTLKVDQLTKDTIKVTGGGTLEVSGDATLEKVELEDESSLVVTGELSGTDIEISGDGAVTAGSIDVNKLFSDGDQTIKAGTIKVDDEIILEGSTVTSDDDGLVTYRIFADSSIEAGKLTNNKNSNNKIKATTIEIPQTVLEEGAKVSLDGEVITETISGPGSLTVNGVIKATGNELSISDGATLEATEIGEGVDTVKVTSGGTFKVNDNTNVGALELGANSALEIDGTLQSSTIEGEGSLVADSVTTGTISNTGDLTITADSINADEIELEKEKTLTLEGNVTTGTISGEGNLDVGGVVGGKEVGSLTITGDTTISGDLNLEAGTTLNIGDSATLTVSGNVETDGDLTISGSGTLAVTGNLTVGGDLAANEDQLKGVAGVVSENTQIYGLKPHLVVHIEDGKSLTLEGLDEDWETITVTGGGTFIIEGIASGSTLDRITLEDGSVMEVTGTLKLSNSASITLDENASLDVTGAVEAAGDVTITLDENASLGVAGAVEVDGDVTISGEGEFDVTGELKVDDLIIDAAKVTVGSLNMANNKTLEITNSGSLTIGEGPTKVSKVVLFDDATLEVVSGAFESDEISGAGSLEAENIVVTTLTPAAGETLTLTGAVDVPVTVPVTVVEVTGDGTVKFASPLTLGVLSIESGTTLEVDELATDTIKITDGGTLKVNDSTTLEKVELEDESSLVVTGELSGKEATGIEVLGDGTIIAGSIVADKLTSDDGDHTIKAETITISQITLEKDATVTLDGEVETNTLQISGGALKVNGDIAVTNDLVLGKDSTLEINGKLTSSTITGEGTLSADSVTADSISNDTGDLTINASLISVGEIILNTDPLVTLTLNGGVSTSKIKGDGRLDVQQIERKGDGPIEIEGDVTIVTDILLGVQGTDTTLDFKDNATLHVEGGIGAWGNLTLSGEGKFEADGVLTIEVALINNEVPPIDVDVKETKAGTPPYGEKPNLVLNVGSGRTFHIEDIETGWETIKVTGGGTLTVGNLPDGLTNIILEDNSTLRVVDGDLVSEKISGSGIIEADSIETTNLETVDGGTLKLSADTTITTNNSGAGKIVTGSGTVKVIGTVAIDELSIDSGATLEASNLDVVGETLEISGGGLLKIDNPPSLKDVDLKDGSQIKIDGDLVFSDDSNISFDDNATLAVDGSITADGDLTLNGEGTLDVTGDLDVEGTLTASADQLEVKGDINANSLSSGVGKPLGVNIEANQTLSVPNLEGHDIVTITGGGTLEITDAVKTTLGEIVFENGSAMVVSGRLKGAGVDSELVLSGNGNLSADSIETSKLSTSGNQTITADEIDVAEIEMSGDKTLTLSGDVTTNKISGAGKTVVIGKTTATDLVIGAGSTLDVSGSQASLNTSGEATVTGVLNLGASGWGSVDFGVGATITLSGDDADLIIGGQPKWYTLYGAQAQYFKDGDVQLRFLEGSGLKKVTPAYVSAIPTETINTVGEKVNFEVTTMNKLNLAGKDLILETGSSTLIADNWWTLGNSFVLGTGTITVNAGATVKYDSNVTWIGGTSGEFVLTGSAQMKYSAATGTKILNTESSGTAQLELKDWKSGDTTRQLNHFLTVEENATVLISKDDDLIVGSGGKIVIEEDGKLIIDDGKELETTETNQLTIRGDVIVKDGATINIKDAMFAFDKNKQTGSVELKSGSIWMAAGTVYYAPSTITTGRRSISFNTDGVDLVFTPYWAGNAVLRNYTVTGAGGAGTFSVNFSGTSITVPSQIITVGDGATFKVNKSFNIAPTDASNSSITVKSGGTLEVVSGNTLKTGDNNRTIKIESGGKLENYGTIEIEGS